MSIFILWSLLFLVALRSLHLFVLDREVSDFYHQPSGDFLPLYEGRVLRQEFISSKNNLQRVGVYVKNIYPNNSGYLVLELLDGDRVIGKSKRFIRGLMTGRFFEVRIPPLSDSREKHYFFTLEAKVPEKFPWFVGQWKPQGNEEGAFSINGVRTDYQLPLVVGYKNMPDARISFLDKMRILENRISQYKPLWAKGRIWEGGILYSFFLLIFLLSFFWHENSNNTPDI